MNIDILFDTPTLEGMQDRVNLHFEQGMKIHKEKLSVFEAYQVRPKERFVPEIWLYRIIGKNGKYYFGKLKDE